MILRPVTDITQTGSPRVSLRCPACRREVTFDSLGFNDASFYAIESGQARFQAGQRKCGNPHCQAHLFVVLGRDGEVILSYPAEMIDFDASDIPTRVVDAFDEAIKCHAQRCYIAAAIMVRKTLEEVCADRGATGENLKAKIAALGDQVVLPPAMLNGLDDLRLLGNDAAHLEARVYEDIGQEELEVAIAVAKEILKATYQYASLMGRLATLKQQQEPAT